MLVLFGLIVWFAIKPKYAVYWIQPPVDLPIDRVLVDPRAYTPLPTDDRFMEL